MRRSSVFLWLVPALFLPGAASFAQTALTDVWHDGRFMRININYRGLLNR
jgi:hypothetical protein